MSKCYLDSNLFDVYLKPYFLEAYRPIRKGKYSFFLWNIKKETLTLDEESLRVLNHVSLSVLFNKINMKK